MAKKADELMAKLTAALVETKATQDSNLVLGVCELKIGRRRVTEDGMTFKACRAAARKVGQALAAWTPSSGFK